METITITLREKDDESGRAYYETDYEPEVLKPLAIALTADEYLRQATLMSACIIISQEDDPAALLDKMREQVKAVIAERNKEDNL